MMFDGKILAITGGSSGIGAAIAKRFADEGGSVLIMSRSLEKAKTVCGSNIEFIQCDVSNDKSVISAFDLIEKKYGFIDFAVNNAGVTTPYVPTAEVEISDWKRVMSVNLDGVFYSMKAQLPLLRKRQGSSLVNISSCAGIVPLPMQAAYVTSKAAVNYLTQTAALEYAVAEDGFHPVRINAVAPGPTLGGMNSPEKLTSNPKNTERKKKATALRRFAEPEEIVDVVEWLLSSRSSFVTGQIIGADGGYSAGKVLS